MMEDDKNKKSRGILAVGVKKMGGVVLLQSSNHMAPNENHKANNKTLIVSSP